MPTRIAPLNCVADSVKRFLTVSTPTLGQGFRVHLNAFLGDDIAKAWRCLHLGERAALLALDM